MFHVKQCSGLALKGSKLNKYADYSNVILFLVKLFYEEHSLSYATIKIVWLGAKELDRMRFYLILNPKPKML